jgi:Helix-turn-helix domain/Family of unknown function (DUF5937)
MLTLEIGVAELAATRFAISPLFETLSALRLLARPGKAAVNAPWVRWAQHDLTERPLRLSRLWPLVINGLPWYPEFLVPAPASRNPAFDDELTRLRATPAEPVRASLRRVFADTTWPDSATELFARPRESLAEIADEFAEFHRRLIAPHWERIRSVLDADIAYRAGLLASGGARALFGDLHPTVRWNAGMLIVTEGDADNTQVHPVDMGPGGLVLVPGVFIWPEPSVRQATSTQTTITYPARGAATVWHPAGDHGAGAAEALLGTPRARLLGTLRSPATTTALARALGVTPGAVSQHLAVLYRGGLVDRQRSGRTVLYHATDLGIALLDQPRRA